METVTPRVDGILLPCDLATLRVARRFVRTMLSAYRDELVYRVQVCANELVTNAIQHSDTKANDGMIMLLIVAREGTLRIEVVDHGSRSDAPHMAGHEDLEAERGRGLLMVDALCDTRGVITDSCGRNIWFEVATR